MFYKVYSQNTELSSVQKISVKGAVTDENDEPMGSVAVWVSDTSNITSVIKSDVTRTNGKFNLTIQANKKYILTVKILGYQTVTKNIAAGAEDIEIGNLKLLPDVKTIKEVVVKPQLTVTADRIIFNFENHPDRAKSNMLDMIQMMPLIWKDPLNNKIYVESPEKTYIVLRKGREDALFNFSDVRFDEMLQKLPAMGFTTFEIWTIVPERYKKYNYVINILPDPTQRLFGAIGGNEASYFANAGDMKLSQFVNGSADKIRFSSNFSFSNLYAPQTKEDVSMLFYPTQTKEELRITQNAVSRSSGETWSAGIMTSIDITKTQFINIGFKGNIGNGRTVKTTNTDSLYSGMHTLMQNKYNSTSEIESWEMSASYQFDFKKRQRMLDISCLISSAPAKNDDNLFTYYENSQGNNRGKLTSSRTNDMKQRIQLDFGDSYMEGKYRLTGQAGYLSTNYDRENSVFDLPTGNNRTDAFSSFEQNIKRLDGYVSLVNNTFKRLSISATMRGDYLLNDQTAKAIEGNVSKNINQKPLLISGGGGFNFRFNIPQPEKSNQTPMPMYGNRIIPGLNSGGGNSSVSIIYNLGRQRPSNDQMNNYVNADNPLSVRRGNPNLKIVNIHHFSFGFSSWFRISPGFGYSFSNNIIAPRTFLETDENGTRIVNSYDNSGKYRSISISGGYSSKTGMMPSSKPFSFRFTHCNFDGSFGKTFFGDGAFTNNYRINISTFCLITIQKYRAGVRFIFSENITTGAYGKKMNPFMLNIDFVSNPIIIKKINLTYSVTLGNLLNLDNKSSNTVNMPEFESITKTTTLRIPVYISIRISYGQFKVKPVKNTRKQATVEGFSN